jgi:acetylornithine deacetylase/succinyl-diaminopimelate desuccinylase-like protein
MLVYFGVRGVVDLELTLYGPARPLHSGHYGNWAPNPALALAHLLSRLRDEDGRISIPGFYREVRPPTPAEREAVAASPDVEAALRHAFALARSEAGGARLVERLLLPALNLRGVAAGGVAERAANAIPAEARASIDFRLVPDQTPQAVRGHVEAYLRALGYEIAHEEPSLELRRLHPRLVRLQWGAGYPSARTPMDLPFSRAVVHVVERAAGHPVVVLPTLGGSVPLHHIVDVLGVPIAGVPIVNHDNNQHAANENLRVQNLWDGILAYAGLLAELGVAWPEQ